MNYTSVYNITFKQLTSNIATLTTSEPYLQISNKIKIGDTVIVKGIDSTFNGTYTITAVTNNTISYFKTSANVSLTSTTGNILINTNIKGNQYVDSPKTHKSETEPLLSTNVARRPRYYMSSKFDQFKYWTSYRQETDGNDNGEYGISKRNSIDKKDYIYDAAPFVVYREKVPVNKLVFKMQTSVGEIDLGPYRLQSNPRSSTNPDPLYGEERKTIPKKWMVQVLKDDSTTWTNIISFSNNFLYTKEDNTIVTRSSTNPIINSDGYVELQYGLDVPAAYQDSFVLVDTIYSSSSLPGTNTPIGYAYLFKETETDKGKLYISDGSGWDIVTPSYSWTLADETISASTKFITKLSDPYSYVENNTKVYRDFQFIRGIRIVVDTMNRPDCTFDLIEMSPRLYARITDKVTAYSVTKTLSDLGSTSIPVGNLFASVGNLSLFDDDFSFSSNNQFNENTNQGSIISKYVDNQMKFDFYDVVRNVNSVDYYIPVKTMYSQGFPQTSDVAATVDIQIRDFFFFLESQKAPSMLLTDVSLSYAIVVLLDNVGFSNYVFKRTTNEKELIIPYFFVGPDQSVAEVLQQLAVSSQSAMFFDEYNNLVVMSKNYMLPSEEERPTDLVLYGQEELVDSKVNLPNIINISSKEKRVYNGGQINYTSRYIQRSLGSISQAPYIDQYKTYTYKPSLLWEVAGQQDRQTINELGAQSSGYSLAATPLNTNLSASLPIVEYPLISNTGVVSAISGTGPWSAVITVPNANKFFTGIKIIATDGTGSLGSGGTYTVTNVNNVNNTVTFTATGGTLPDTGTITNIRNAEKILNNNTMDLGEGIYWLGNYSGYLYANGEIIKYDAVEYVVQGVGNVWISNNHEYQDYFSALKFNGKMYPSGSVRIYAEPKYEEYPISSGTFIMSLGDVKEHGRGQFGTTVTEHIAGLTESSHWIKDTNIKGCIQSARQYMFTMNKTVSYPTGMGVGEAGNTKNTTGGQFSSYEYAIKSSRNGIIKNFMANKNYTENEIAYMKTAQSGAIQSSALVFNGPPLPSGINSADFVSYIYKQLDKPYTHFGTRMRIIGKIESSTNQSQTASGGYSIISSNSVVSPNSSSDIKVTGGSGGIGFGINSAYNNGYFFEIVALSTNSVSAYTSNNSVKDFEIVKSPVTQSVDGLVTVTTKTQHTFNVGDKIIVSGLVDDNRKTQTTTTLNGEFSVTSIGNNRKTFQYQITPPPTGYLTPSITTSGVTSSTSLLIQNSVPKVFTIVPDQIYNFNITNKQLTSNVATLTTSTNHTIKVGDSVTVTGVDATFNGTYTVTATASNTFNYAKTAGDISSTAVSPAGSVSGTNTLFTTGMRLRALNPTTPSNYMEGVVTILGTTMTMTVDAIGGSGTYASWVISLASNIGAKGDGTSVTYLCNNEFSIGQLVTITGMKTSTGSSLNLTNAIIQSRTSSQFTVSSTVVGSGFGGIATFVPLSTISQNGGTVSINLEDDIAFSNIFFYKVLAGQNKSEIIKKARTGNVATLTTLIPHSFIVNDSITVSNVDAALNGTYTITAVTQYTLSYQTSTSGTIAETQISPIGLVVGNEKVAIPQTLWQGLADIIVDDGKFTGLSRMVSSEKTTVYDLSVEYVNIGSVRRFYLYLNNKQLAVIDDPDPLPEYNNLALFVRGSSKCMFENVYALNTGYENTDPNKAVQIPISKVFGDQEVNANEALNKYAINGFVQQTFLSGIGSEQPPKYQLFYDEFGTIMREAVFFNVRYDRAFPALYSKIADTLNGTKGYTVSGYYAGSYGAEFMIFNCTDKNLNLDDTTGNYLRILGIAFTQNTTYSLTVDEYLKRVSNLSDAPIYDNLTPGQSLNYKKIYDTIKNSRLKYGVNEFSIESPYLQTTAAAEAMLDWIINKTIDPRKTIGVNTFATPTLQLGDIVTMNYKNSDGLYVVADANERYVVYNIENQKGPTGTQMTVHLAEV